MRRKRFRTHMRVCIRPAAPVGGRGGTGVPCRPDRRITCRKQEQYIQCSMHVVFVDSVAQLPQLRSVLGRATCVALDVEWRPAGLLEPTVQGGKQKPAKQDPAALLQLAVWEGAVCCAVAEAGDGGSAAAGRAAVPFGTRGAALLPDLQLPVQTFVIDLLKLGVRFLLRSVSATVSVTVSACRTTVPREIVRGVLFAAVARTLSHAGNRSRG